jgi:hypothetical protein
MLSSVLKRCKSKCMLSRTIDKQFISNNENHCLNIISLFWKPSLVTYRKNLVVLFSMDVTCDIISSFCYCYVYNL